MLRARQLVAVRFSVVVLLGACLSNAHAADRVGRVGDASDALPGLGRVGIADLSDKPGTVSLAATLGYGFTEPQPSESGSHHRASGVLALGVTTAKWLDVSVGSSGRYDRHPSDGTGRDDGWVFDPRLVARSGWLLGSVALGAELVATLPGSESLGTSLKATSLDAKLLLGTVGNAFTFGSYAGFRYDRSAMTEKGAGQLRFGDRLAIGLSDFNSILVGAAGGYRIANTLVFAEASGDVLIGQGAPPFGQSPLRVDLGAREFLSSALSVEGLCEVGLSSRPVIAPSAPLIPIEPRFTTLLGLRYRFGESAPPVPIANQTSPSSGPKATDAAPPAATDVAVSVTDEQGAPLKEAKVEIVLDDKTYVLEPDETGRHRASRVPLGRGTLSIRAEGRKPIDQPIELKSGAPLSVDVRSEPVLPSGQVRGLVRSYDGKAVVAKISVEPKGLHTNSDAQGFFQMDVPPGAYQVIVEAKGYRAQRRSVTVEKDGVLILNADLARER